MDRRLIGILATLLILSILAAAVGTVSLSLGGGNGFEPDPVATEADDEIDVTTTVTDPTLLYQFTLFDLQSLAVVDAVGDTYAPGDTVELEFTDTAHTSCDTTEFRIEVREPGSSVTDLRGSDALQKYDGSVMTDQLVTGEVAIHLPDDAPEGEWEAMGYLYCLDDESVGDPDHDTFTVETVSVDPDPVDDPADDTDETGTENDGNDDDEEDETGTSDEDDSTGGDDTEDTTEETDDETDETREDEEQHWTVDAVLDLWDRITGVFR